jgi:DNA-binding NarL/FixJ family response regulator
MVRVLIADEYPIVRRGVRGLIEAQPGWSVCAEAADGLRALDLACREQPDVVVIDVGLPVQNGVVVTSRLKRSLPNVEVLLFTVQDDEQTISSGLAAGARGYLLKGETAGYLVTAVAALAAHRSFFSPVVSDLLLDSAMVRAGKALPKSFTTRELEVMQLVCDGENNSRIARRLGISLKTVETHRGATMRKAGAHTAGELVRFALKNHLVRT